MLRAKSPEAIKKRLKIFMFGEAGVGKTTAAIQLPKPYILDTEKGSENYADLIKSSGGVVFQTTDISEMVAEIRALQTEKHGYRTLVIDPITTVYQDLIEKCEKKVGSEFGRHFGEANKQMKRMVNLIMSLDMNVVMTSHAKTEYGQNLAKLGVTFDAWKNLPYLFDLVVELAKKGPKRYATVKKTRLAAFPDGDCFEFSYDVLKDRYGADILEKEANSIVLATADQVREIKDLLAVVKLPDGLQEKWLAKAGVEDWADMPKDTLGLCIDYVKNRVPSKTGAS